MAKDLKMAMLLDYYGDFLTEKQLDIMQLYYDEDMSLTEIGEYLQITRQGARDAIKRSEDLLLTMENRIGLAKKRDSILKAVEIMKEMSNDAAFLLQGMGAIALEGQLAKMSKTLEGLLDGI